MLALGRCPFGENGKSARVVNNKDPNEKQPGEKEPGKCHYNPGNMSDKTIDNGKDGSEQRADVRDRKERGPQPRQLISKVQ
jgi:hypothetical protein